MLTFTNKNTKLDKLATLTVIKVFALIAFGTGIAFVVTGTFLTVFDRKKSPSPAITSIDRGPSHGANVIVNGDPTYYRRIKDMTNGDVGYTVPWALNPSTGKINVEHIALDAPGGTVRMKVSRLENGYVVDVPPDYKW